jgi:hypothetical protein
MGILYHYLMQQDWDRTVIYKLILEATPKAKNKHTVPPPTTSDARKMKNTIFFHFRFHKSGISSQDTRK